MKQLKVANLRRIATKGNASALLCICAFGASTYGVFHLLGTGYAFIAMGVFLGMLSIMWAPDEPT